MNKKFKFISIGSLKGGVGKTTTAVSISSILAKRDKKVLLIDGDYRLDSLAYLRIDGLRGENGYTDGLLECDNMILEKMVGDTFIENICVLDGNKLLYCIENTIGEIDIIEIELKKYIDKNLEFFNKFDYIIADTNPNIDKVAQAIFIAADTILCVSDVVSEIVIDGGSVNAFNSLLIELSKRLELERNLKVNAVLLNKLNSMSFAENKYTELMKEASSLNDILLSNSIGELHYLVNAQRLCTPISQYFVEEYCEDYNVVVDELMKIKML